MQAINAKRQQQINVAAAQNAVAVANAAAFNQGVQQGAQKAQTAANLSAALKEKKK